MRAVRLILLLISFTSCSSIPEINQTTSKNSTSAITYPFVTKKLKLVHSLQAKLPNGDIVSIIGIIKTFPDKKELNVILMTAEGMVLLVANNKNSKININRGITPFNDLSVVESMINDIKLITFVPDYVKIENGIINNRQASRFWLKDESKLDVIKMDNNLYRINRYSKSSKLEKTISYSDFNKHNIAGNIKLKKVSFIKYSIDLELISLEK